MGVLSKREDIFYIKRILQKKNTFVIFQIGHYFAERHKWDEAVQYYEKASNTEKLVECYYLLEDYDNLENLIDLLQPNDPLLISMGQMFASVGMGKQSVEAFLKCNKISNAIGKSNSILYKKYSQEN